MRVLVVYPKVGYEQGLDYFHVPYSALAVASAISPPVAEPVVLDLNVLAESEGWASLHQELVRGGLLCVGISSMIGHQLRNALEVARRVRSIDASLPIVWGGAAPTLLRQLTSAHELCDLVVSGQGERVFPSVVERVKERSGFDGLPAVSFKKGESVVHNLAPKSAPISELASYRPVFDLVDVSAYLRVDPQIGDKTISYHSSQGCVFNCGFCCEAALWGRRWRGAPVNTVMDEVGYLVRRHGANGIKFYDSEFFVSRRRALRFAAAVLDSGMRFRWGAAVHPQNLVRFTSEEIGLLRKSGLSRLMIGAESVADDEIALIAKRTSSQVIIRASRLCSEHGIAACFSFITGFPGTEADCVERTLEFAGRLRETNPRHEVQINFYAPYPGTPLYPLAVAHGFTAPSTLEEWSCFDYRQVTTPWVDEDNEASVRRFNEENYPFLADSRWRADACDGD